MHEEISNFHAERKPFIVIGKCVNCDGEDTYEQKMQRGIEVEKPYSRESRQKVLHLIIESPDVALFGTVDATQPYTFRVDVVQHFGCVTIEDGDAGADKTYKRIYWVEQDQSYVCFNSASLLSCT